MARAGVILAALLLVMVPTLTASPTRSLHVSSESGSLIWCVPVRTNDVVQLQFTHSMFGGYVREQWQVAPGNRLQRARFVTENAAAAEYYATDGTSYRDTDGYVVPGESLQENELVIRVNDRGDHRLSIGVHTIHLAEEVPQNTQVRIFIANESCENEN